MPEIDVNMQFLSVKVRDGHDPSKPVPLLIKYADDATPNAWATGTGDRVFIDREWAEKSMEMDTAAYKERMAARTDAGRLVRATVVENWDGWVSVDGDENDYFASPEDLLQGYRDNAAWSGVPFDEIEQGLPAWCFATTETVFKFDLESAIATYLDDDHHDDARERLVGFEAMLEAFHQWAEKQSITTYYIDYSRIVVLDRERFDAALADALEVIAADEAANG